MMRKHFAFIVLSALMVFSQDANAQNNGYAQVKSLLESSRPEEALLVLDSIGRADRGSEGVYQYYRAQAFLSMQRYDESLQLCKEQFSRLTKKDTLLHKFYFMSSLCHDLLGNRDEAIKQLDKAIRLKPDEILYYLNASFYHGERGDFKTCLSSLDKALQLEPQNVYVLNNLSYYSSMNEQYGKALDYANKGMLYAKDDNSIAFLLNNRGFAHLGMRNFDAAKEDIDDALALYPENPYAYYNRAMLHILLQEDDQLVCENLQLAVLYGYIYPLDEMKEKYCR